MDFGVPAKLRELVEAPSMAVTVSQVVALVEVEGDRFLYSVLLVILAETTYSIPSTSFIPVTLPVTVPLMISLEVVLVPISHL
jgi:hypothetical protein